MFLQGVSGIQVADCKDLFTQYIKSDDESEKNFVIFTITQYFVNKPLLMFPQNCLCVNLICVILT